jgi:hypothetical protein
MASGGLRRHAEFKAVKAAAYQRDQFPPRRALRLMEIAELVYHPADYHPILLGCIHG